MTPQRAVKLWVVNVLSFILLSVLTVTGAVNWLLLPRGYRGGENVLRHVLRDIHQWSALLFLLLIVVHLVLHWSYIKSSLKRYGLLK